MQRLQGQGEQTKKIFPDIFGEVSKKAEDQKDIYRGDFDKGLVLGGNLPITIQTDSLSFSAGELETVLSISQSIADETVSGKNSVLEESTTSKKEKDRNAQPNTTRVDGRAANQSTNVTALSYYNSGQYKSAIIEFKKLLAANNNDYQSLYYLAMSYYYNGEKDAAIPHLDSILKKKNNPFYDLALWQKAQILTEKNHTGEARDLLNEIIKRGGTLKNNAIQKIEELDKSE